MTRKDYIKIAECFKNSYEYREHMRTDEVFHILIDEICNVLKADNERFDKNKFINYIQGE